MIDIVFQLIAFFIFSLSYSPETVTTDVKPPKTDNLPESPKVEMVLIEIDREGHLLGPGGPLVSTDPNFEATLESMLPPSQEERLLVIRADYRAPYFSVDRVLAWCREKKTKHIALRLRTEQP